jgi:predicted ATPase/DNA-binding SARP family transcriptional activator
MVRCIQLLGGLAVRDGDRVVAQFPTRQTAALLALLALRAGEAVPREELQELLWPDADPQLTRHRLNQALSALRALLDGGRSTERSLRSDSQVARLCGFRTDARDWETAAEQALQVPTVTNLAAAIQGYRGDLLPGVYEDWCVSERERLRSLFLALLLRQADLLGAQGQFREALNLAYRATDVDPACEAAHAALLRFLTTLGRGAEALRHHRAQRARWEMRFGVPYPRALRQLASSLLTVDADTPAGPHVPPSRLPMSGDTLLGREPELDRVEGWFRSGVRCVTLVGTGGVGKTRLALEIAQRLAPTFEGVWWVSLEDLRDPALLPGSLASVLELPATAEPLEQVIRSLAGARGLLVLDNLEQILEPAAGLVFTLHARLPHLSLLATSRSALSLAEEQVVSVPPLPVPSRKDGFAAAISNPGVRLVAERARRHLPEFDLTEENVAGAAELVAALEGIPLALELAAARLAVFPAPDLLTSLFAPIGEAPDTSQTRHASLRAVLDWSVGLLPEDRRAFFRRLAVFRGGWTVAAAEAVTGNPDARHHLGELRRQSLIIPVAGGKAPRYRLLEPIRELLTRDLSDAGAAATRRAHLEWVLNLFEPVRTAPVPELLCAELEAEHDNLRAALEWSVGAGMGPRAEGARLTAAAWRFWRARGHFREGHRWLESVLGEVLPSAAERGALVLGLGTLRWHLGEYGAAEAPLREAVVLLTASGDLVAAAEALNSLAALLCDRGTTEEAVEVGAQCVALRREFGNPGLLARALNNQGSYLRHVGRAPEAAACYQEAALLAQVAGDELLSTALRLQEARELASRGHQAAALGVFEECGAAFERLGERRGIAHTLGLKGNLLIDIGDQWAAQGAFSEALRVWRELSHRQGIASALLRLGVLARGEGRVEQAREQLTESLQLYLLLGSEPEIRSTFWELGLAELAAGQFARAAQLLAAGEPGIRLLPRLSWEAVLEGRAARLLQSPRYARRLRLGREQPMDELAQEVLLPVISPNRGGF